MDMELPAFLSGSPTTYPFLDMDARKQPGAELVSFFSHNTLPWMLLPLDLDVFVSGWLDLPPCCVCHLLVCFSLLPAFV